MYSPGAAETILEQSLAFSTDSTDKIFIKTFNKVHWHRRVNRAVLELQQQQILSLHPNTTPAGRDWSGLEGGGEGLDWRVEGRVWTGGREEVFGCPP